MISFGNVIYAKFPIEKSKQEDSFGASIMKGAKISDLYFDSYYDDRIIGLLP
jgi:hypothetical protein